MKITVLGAGTMGSGIAQLAAMNGHNVVAFDTSPDALQNGRVRIDDSLRRFAKAGKLSADDIENVTARLTLTDDLAKATCDASVVVESVIEKLDVKRAIFAEAVELAPVDCIFGSNTSQLSITAIGAGLGHANAPRLVGIHFFNPPVMMRLVELTRGYLTSEATLDHAREFAASLDREVVVLNKDVPGFITTRISGLVRMECLRILEEGVASAEDIDRACRLGLNYPMGPLELGDFNGLDTYLSAMDSLADSLGERFRPTPTLRNMVMAGLTGRKNGKGFYNYDEKGRRSSE
ncbi:3-hydroxyacyl-CoA dehydrogenase family protein [Sciscionella marina]|uniref:3-hydroxyacyl-CoA dehydrogenase family protein n=1 Tax=Sciscionella marina TaxID=508770 RepID=UPI00037B94E1|nr:3-hydroxyacyl-CoA dehydrogenase family protein [Sciscionella marina]